jgi:hypothetical protein
VITQVSPNIVQDKGPFLVINLVLEVVPVDPGLGVGVVVLTGVVDGLGVDEGVGVVLGVGELLGWGVELGVGLGVAEGVVLGVGEGDGEGAVEEPVPVPFKVSTTLFPSWEGVKV